MMPITVLETLERKLSELENYITQLNIRVLDNQEVLNENKLRLETAKAEYEETKIFMESHRG
jgi:hypothetical protein